MSPIAHSSSSPATTVRHMRARPRRSFHIGGADPVFFHSTAGLRGYKGSVYEGGLRVPMIARLPGKHRGRGCQRHPQLFRRLVPDPV